VRPDKTISRCSGMSADLIKVQGEKETDKEGRQWKRK
jgi:hypothetical protein